jgi:hypothetical protein
MLPLAVIASCVSYVLLRCAPTYGEGFGLPLRSSQLAVSTPFGVRPSVHPRWPPLGKYACVPSFPSRQELARKSPALPLPRPPAAPAQASDFRSPRLVRPAKQISCLLHGKPATRRESTLRRPPGSVQSSENLLWSSATQMLTETTLQNHPASGKFCNLLQLSLDQLEGNGREIREEASSGG